MSAAEDIARALYQLKNIIETHENSGDWYGCVENAIPYLEESLNSMPPGISTFDRTFPKP